MSSLGVFLKEEIDGKPFLVFTLAQTKNPTTSSGTLAINSGSDNLPFQPLFFCPASRINFQNLNLTEEDKEKFRPFNSSPHFPNTRSGDQQGGSLLDCDQHGICKLPVVPLFWCNNKSPSSDEFMCSAQQTILHVSSVKKNSIKNASSLHLRSNTLPTPFTLFDFIVT